MNIKDLPNESRFDTEEVKLDAVLVDDIKRMVIENFNITVKDVESYNDANVGEGVA